MYYKKLERRNKNQQPRITTSITTVSEPILAGSPTEKPEKGTYF